MRLQPKSEHPPGLEDAGFDALFTTNEPVIFAFHAYPWLIHRLTYRRTNHHNLHVRELHRAARPGYAGGPQLAVGSGQSFRFRMRGLSVKPFRVVEGRLFQRAAYVAGPNARRQCNRQPCRNTHRTDSAIRYHRVGRCP